jgi:uncharacterized damage-inducible protein DinB
MDILQLLIKEFDEEVIRTRKMLERIPEDKWGWKPHEKSMPMQNLVVHIAELPTWITMGLNTSELDFGTSDYKPTQVSSRQDVLDLFEKSAKTGRESLVNAKEEDLLPTWTMRNGEQIYSTMTKYEVIRHAFSQTIHHRAQLGVYLRLLNIPIPGSYGPSADESF